MSVPFTRTDTTNAGKRSRVIFGDTHSAYTFGVRPWHWIDVHKLAGVSSLPLIAKLEYTDG